MTRIIEFLEAENQRLSIKNVTLLGCFMVSSGIMLTLAYQAKMTGEYLGMYLTAFSGTYLIGKRIERAGQVLPFRKGRK